MKGKSNKKGNVAVQPDEIMPLFGELFTRSIVKELLQEIEPKGTVYWRILTPLVVMWGFIYQRLNHDHSCEEYVSHLHSGGVDLLDKEDEHEEPLSKRLDSESTSGYVQGRKRLPLALLGRAVQRVTQEAQQIAGEKGQWMGMAVRLLDGTCFRLPPKGDLVETYGRFSNRYGSVHWVMVRALVACDYFSQAVVGWEEGSLQSSEQGMVPDVVGQDVTPGSLYLGDQNFGIYSVVHAVTNQDHHVLLRMTESRFNALLKKQTDSRPVQSGESRQVIWKPSRHDKVSDQWPADPIVGRLIYLHIAEKGYRPTELYLFTSLLDEEAYPSLELAALYHYRWNVETHLRTLKQSLEMDYFDVQSAAIFHKELAAGFLTYNLICILLLQAALRVNLLPSELSFKRCMRRILTALTTGVPAWVQEEGRVADHLLDQLGKCRLPKQPNKVKHEPRKVRSIPSPFSTLRGDRDAAREEVLNNLKEDTKS